MKNRKIPFDFILDALYTEEVEIKPMFGCFGIYVNNRMCFFLRKRADRKELNGVWVALASPEAYNSLTIELPSVNQDEKLVENKKKSNTWLLISVFDDDFEELVNKACDLILNKDKRIGKTTRGSL